MNPTLTILLVVVIGIVVGIGALRVNRPSWLTRQIAGGRRAELTSALVGIAGAFIGFHLGALAVFDAIILLVFALVGAVLVVWAWREVRL
ncbi:MAG: transglycosylase [Devosia sp.]